MCQVDTKPDIIIVTPKNEIHKDVIESNASSSIQDGRVGVVDEVAGTT